MFCPKCKAEYREGFTRCAECEVDLVPELSPDLEDTIEYVHLVHIESYADRPEAEMAKGVLSANGIEAVISGDEFGGYSPAQAFTTGVQLFVNDEDFEEAKKILSELEKPD